MTLQVELQRHGLHIRGLTRLTRDEMENHGFDAGKPMLALVGNIGSSYWPVFSRSSEFEDGLAHPLDRWSRRIANDVAAAHGLTPVFPFDGPPYFPFQQWAARAEKLQQSPIGVMMHPEYGLWHSYRFALIGADFAVDAPAPGDSPCLGCSEQPCLSRCPVDAFDAAGYDVDRCADYLRDTPQAECHQTGCLARYACPVAPEFRYQPAQGQFHLRAFLQARPQS